MAPQSLAAAERIRRRSDFERVYKDGVRVQGRFMTVFLLPNGLPHPRLGVAATRKLGSAVKRNRAKRLAREIFRRHKMPAGHDVVIVPRREMLDAPFASLEADFAASLTRPARDRRPRRDARGGDRRVRADSRV
jgi:ribonuclease P protein component